MISNRVSTCQQQDRESATASAYVATDDDDTRGRQKKPRESFCGSSWCIVLSVLLVLTFLYVGLTAHIVRRGHKSRIQRKHAHKENDLATHPHYQHHDLSSVLLEGLPPLRKKAHGREEEGKEEKEEGFETELAFDMDVQVVPDEWDIGSKENKPTELTDFDPVAELRQIQYLRGLPA